MKLRRFIMILLLSIPLFIMFLYYENNSITVSKYSPSFGSLPSEFKGFKILQISDLHSKSFGDNQQDLVESVKEEKPDLIVITGDLFDKTKPRYIEAGMDLISQITSTAPVYFVTGNHEWYTWRFDEIAKQLAKLDVKVLQGTGAEIVRGKQRIYLAGIDDIAKNGETYTGQKLLEQELQKTMAGREGDLSVLLAHRPELLPVYAATNPDLVFAGHAHGGQFRLPFLGGVIAPGQGLFPKYTAGLYKEADTTMVVSRGLGNSIISQRLFNRPEIVIVTLN